MLEQSSNANPATRRTAAVRRERIIIAAHTLFARHGFHGTSMAEIARVSDVLVGQIYRDFADKEDLIAAIVERDTSELLDDPQLTRAIEGGEAAALTDWVKHFIALALDTEARSIFAGILSEATRNSRLAAILTQAHERLRMRLASAATVWSPGPERETDRQKFADLVLMVRGAVLYGAICGLHPNDNTVSKFIELVDVEIEKFSHST